eukprot:comp22192_c0_seq1/m.52302 comp22192_c0_seq1/g.52302  ORF comp22192_c0_seq1/g.52302 comp22192_c0_seq1/m.52302 type:complete len:355 (+) comp22192_c0_seq1:2460-3524(+)
MDIGPVREGHLKVRECIRGHRANLGHTGAQRDGLVGRRGGDGESDRPGGAAVRSNTNVVGAVRAPVGAFVGANDHNHGHALGRRPLEAGVVARRDRIRIRAHKEIGNTAAREVERDLNAVLDNRRDIQTVVGDRGVVVGHNSGLRDTEHELRVHADDADKQCVGGRLCCAEVLHSNVVDAVVLVTLRLTCLVVRERIDHKGVVAKVLRLPVRAARRGLRVCARNVNVRITADRGDRNLNRRRKRGRIEDIVAVLARLDRVELRDTKLQGHNLGVCCRRDRVHERRRGLARTHSDEIAAGRVHGTCAVAVVALRGREDDRVARGRPPLVRCANSRIRVAGAGVLARHPDRRGAAG